MCFSSETNYKPTIIPIENNGVIYPVTAYFGITQHDVWYDMNDIAICLNRPYQYLMLAVPSRFVSFFNSSGGIRSYNEVEHDLENEVYNIRFVMNQLGFVLLMFKVRAAASLIDKFFVGMNLDSADVAHLMDAVRFYILSKDVTKKHDEVALNAFEQDVKWWRIFTSVNIEMTESEIDELNDVDLDELNSTESSSGELDMTQSMIDELDVTESMIDEQENAETEITDSEIGNQLTDSEIAESEIL